MKQLPSSRHLIRIWHRREKATIDHLIRAIGDGKDAAGTMHSAYTASGLSIQDQVRKAWQPCSTGLAMF